MSLAWLTNTIKTKRYPLWESAALDVIPVDQLPKLTKVSLWIPKASDKKDHALKRLET